MYFCPGAASPNPAPISPIFSAQADLQLESVLISSPQDDPSLQTPPSGQLLLGTDKRNPVFAVYLDDLGERLLDYYGFEIIEIVKNDTTDPVLGKGLVAWLGPDPQTQPDSRALVAPRGGSTLESSQFCRRCRVSCQCPQMEYRPNGGICTGLSNFGSLRRRSDKLTMFCSGKLTQSE